MPTRFEHPLHGVSFAAMVLKEIIDKPLDGETAQARLKQIGLMTILYHMHLGNIALTFVSIGEFTGLKRAGFEDSIELLINRGLLTETVALNVIGRGRARMFHISVDIFERLKHFEIA